MSGNDGSSIASYLHLCEHRSDEWHRSNLTKRQSERLYTASHKFHWFHRNFTPRVQLTASMANLLPPCWRHYWKLINKKKKILFKSVNFVSKRRLIKVHMVSKTENPVSIFWFLDACLALVTMYTAHINVHYKSLHTSVYVNKLKWAS